MANLNDLGAKLLSADDVRALFAGAWWHEVFSTMRPTMVQFFDHSLAVDELAPGDGPWAIIVHGDLHATGDLDFTTSDYKTSLLVVQGGVRARNFRFTNGATCVVAHDLVASDFVMGRYGDESARLEVGGVLRARALLLDHVTGVDVSELDAIVCTSEGWRLPIDIEYQAKHGSIFEPEVLHDGSIDLGLAWQAATAGDPIFLPGVEAELRTTPRLRDRDWR